MRLFPELVLDWRKLFKRLSARSLEPGDFRVPFLVQHHNQLAHPAIIRLTTLFRVSLWPVRLASNGRCLLRQFSYAPLLLEFQVALFFPRSVPLTVGLPH